MPATAVGHWRQLVLALRSAFGQLDVILRAARGTQRNDSAIFLAFERIMPT
jgi:hypothetical protein